MRPRDGKPARKDIPDVCVSLEWIYGFSCRGLRGSVGYLHTGEIVYPSGSNVIVLDPTEGVGKHVQRYFQGHMDTITAQSVCLSSSGAWSVVATAELGPMPRVCVWDPIACTLIAEGRCPHGRNVSHMSWSPDGSLLLSVGTDPRRTVCLWTVCSGSGLLELVYTECLLDQSVAPVCGLDEDAELGLELAYPADATVGHAAGEAAETALWKRERRRLQNRGASQDDLDNTPRPLHDTTSASRLGPGKVLSAGFVSASRAVVCGV